MNRCTMVRRYLMLACLLSVAFCHESLFEDDDFENLEEYEKKPVPEAKNPIRDNAKFVQDRAHIRDHMGKIKVDIDKESDGGIEFHFFNSHDTDQDGHLDGLELYHSMEHSMEDQLNHIDLNTNLREGARHLKIQRLYTQLIGTVDKILYDDDLNNDGYLSYGEYMKARRGSTFRNVVTGDH